MSRNVIVCFPGGAAGHLVGAIISFITTGKKFAIEDNGSVHGFQCTRYLDGRLLDLSVDSMIQEHVDISRLPDFDLAIAHFRNIAQLQSLGKTIIYVDIDSDDVEVVSNRLQTKMSSLMTREVYDILKGTDWPDYDGIADTALLDLKQIRIDFLQKWFYTIPVNQQNIFRLPFKEITDIKWVDRLTTFLNIPGYDRDFIINILDEYKQRQL